jgi:hypothetical protein
MKIIKALRILAIAMIGVITLILIIAMLVYPPEYVYRTVAWLGSDAFDWQKFPFHSLKAPQTTYHFKSAPDPRVEKLFEQLSGTEDWNNFWNRTIHKPSLLFRMELSCTRITSTIRRGIRSLPHFRSPNHSRLR